MRITAHWKTCTNAWWEIWFSWLLLIVSSTTISAQVVGVGLYPTAIPDSFDVKAFSSGATIEGAITALSVSVRWDASAGGEMDAMDIKDGCAGAPAIGVGGVHELLGYRYVTFNSFQFRPLGDDCAITSEGIVLFGFRIRSLSGCRHVGLVGNAFTGLNNTGYYLSVNGLNVTGEIITGPISSGDCPPCEPPVITEIGADSVPYCANGVNLWSQATGTLPDHAWYRPNGTLVAWQPQLQSQFEPAGTYTLVVSNACGADTAQVEAAVDPALCVPIAIDSAWATSYGSGSYPGIQLHASSMGSCPQYTWVVPWGDTLPTNMHYYVNVPNPTAGDYTLIASNACGSDTLVLHIDPPQPCATPTATAAITTNDSCRTRRAHFTASATGPGPITTRWYGADGQLITGSTTFSVPYAPWGTYTFTATNHCSTDTVVVFHGPADTTGLAACEPPQIVSLSSVPAACIGDTVQFVVTTALSGPCASLALNRVEVLDMVGDTATVVLNQAGPLTVTATNACGQVTQEVPIDVIAPALVHRNQCRVLGPLSMDSLVATYIPMPAGGQWWLGGVPHSGIYDPAVDTSGIYHYYMDTSGVFCKVVEFGLYEYPGVYAGEDTALTVCSSDPPFQLFDLLGDGAYGGGHWMLGPPFPAIPYVSSLFDPATSGAGTYRYGVSAPFASGGGCSDHADIQVSVTQATTWFADHDGDGLGDPADTLLACEPPAGYVDMAGDACPGVYGTIGDACDDGNPNTINDVLGEDCECTGEVGTGMAEEQLSGLSLWPNPGSSGFSLTGFGSGMAELRLLDMQGRVVLGRRSVNEGERIGMNDLAAGSYVVEVRTDGVQVHRLRWVKQ